MDLNYLQSMFSLEGKTAVVTGGGGILCSGISQGLAKAGAKVAVLDRNYEAAGKVASQIEADGGAAIPVACDVLDKDSILKSAETVLGAFQKIDILVNGAGGNNPRATTSAEVPFFDIPADALQWVFNLNIIGTVLPSQVYGRCMADTQQGAILNISSMNAYRPLTRIPAYSAAKAAVSNFTQWLAVHMAQEYSTNIRVNAIAPGFFLTEQNRFLLTDKETGALTPRGSTILGHTPQGKFGVPDDLLGAVLWLVSPSASFVTGVVVPIDGGFSAFSGV